ncbi:PREDICTED: LOW QUALITY PROTEIN: uncharacterized protein C9orf173 homolog [Lipotes vexillifer]|uniref:LOW QUALITY PROTEIN: uncharacterized protein C9orf173 homolog n=1 Tax=Lipotes vexillifer TaxID=118797 RepID=A0A340YLQ3_LIPVE|nr:PREDICTED: LOW QUALITY PROTEIN: uncharacterized protein C9orf173 homolog [Lipotes vexillifer]
MHFDQKAVKFLATFHINGGEHWTHGPLKQKPLVTSHPGPVWGGRPVGGGPPGGPRPRACFPPGLERRPPVVTDLGIPGPTRYRVPDASARESSPLPHFTIGCPHDTAPTAEGGGCRAWQTVWCPSESPFTQNADFNREQLHRLRHPSRVPPAGCRLPGPCPPAFSMSRSPLLASWVGSFCTLGPAAYGAEDCYNSYFPSAMGVVIQGLQRPKCHDTGASCALSSPVDPVNSHGAVQAKLQPIDSPGFTVRPGPCPQQQPGH